MGDYYVLDANHQPRSVTVEEWAAMYERPFEETRRVAATEIGELRISTVFLGLDHNFGARGGPVLFETMVFGVPDGEPCWRYRTWDEALAGHEKVVAAIKAGTNLDDLDLGDD